MKKTKFLNTKTGRILFITSVLFFLINITLFLVILATAEVDPENAYEYIFNENLIVAFTMTFIIGIIIQISTSVSFIVFKVNCHPTIPLPIEATTECPTCHGLNPDGNQFCSKCGSSLIKKDEMVQGTPDINQEDNLIQRIESDKKTILPFSSKLFFVFYSFTNTIILGIIVFVLSFTLCILEAVNIIPPSPVLMAFFSILTGFSFIFTFLISIVTPIRLSKSEKNNSAVTEIYKDHMTVLTKTSSEKNQTSQSNTFILIYSNLIKATKTIDSFIFVSLNNEKKRVAISTTIDQMNPETILFLDSVLDQFKSKKKISKNS
ncbi:MAG: hypothetical protein WCR67_03665 [Bacilli bacterium]